MVPYLQSIIAYTSGTEDGILEIQQQIGGSLGILTYLNLLAGNDTDILTKLGQLKSDTASIGTDIADIEYLLRHWDTPDYTARLQSLQTSLDSFSSRNHTDLNNLWWQNKDLLSLLSNDLSRIYTRMASVGKDVLAGNPWWATNSDFALVRSKYASAFPDDGKNTVGLYSFPQFLSKWSSFLSYPISGTSSDATTVDQNWFNYFGHLSDRTGRPLAFDQDNPYTWFHFMADATRSNWTERASWRSYVHTVDVAGYAASNSIADDISYQQYQDTHAVNEADDTMRSTTEPDVPDYTVASVSDDPDADKNNLLDALDEDVEHSTRLVLIDSSDFRAATGVDGEMVYNLGEGRFSTFVSDMSSISKAGWYALLAVMSATLFWRKQNEISAIVKGTNFSRV